MVDFAPATHSSKSERSREKDSERKSRKRRKHEDDGRKHKHRRKGSDSKLQIVDDDANDEDMWVEKNIDMDGDKVKLITCMHTALTYCQILAANIPTADSLKLTSSAMPGPSDPKQPPNLSAETPLRRDEWMLLPPTIPSVPTDTRKHIQVNDAMTDDYGEPSGGQRTLVGGIDYFSSLGTDGGRKARPDRPDPDRVAVILFYDELWVDIN
jgi:hypothetical protein